jgi:hypothetical protein
VQRSGKDWVKAHAICGTKTNVVTAVVIEGRDANDCPLLKPMVEKTAENFTVKEVSADKGYLSKENLALVEKFGAEAFIPFKVNSGPNGDGIWDRLYHYYSFNRETFLAHHHQRSNAESTFSMVKAKFRDHVRSKTDTAMKNEVLCKFLCLSLPQMPSWQAFSPFHRPSFGGQSAPNIRRSSQRVFPIASRPFRLGHVSSLCLIARLHRVVTLTAIQLFAPGISLMRAGRLLLG